VPQRVVTVDSDHPDPVECIHHLEIVENRDLL
jgi:hypothetical protein